MSTADAGTPRDADPSGSSTPTVAARGAPLPGEPLATATAASATDRASPRGCPFLVAEAGGWRLDVPSREHRCGAFSPPAPLAPEKQARLCLTPKHTGCATYLASLDARTERLGGPPLRRATRWGLARTTSVIEDPGGVRARLLAIVLDRKRWPAIPAVILITTLFVLAVSGLRTGVPATAVSTARPSITASAPAASIIATAVAAPVETPVTSSAPSASPAPLTTPTAPTPGASTAKPAATFRTYRVKSGDTLGAIASRFGTSVSALVRVNNLSDPSHLTVGQVLRIP